MFLLGKSFFSDLLDNSYASTDLDISIATASPQYSRSSNRIEGIEQEQGQEQEQELELDK